MKRVIICLLTIVASLHVQAADVSIDACVVGLCNASDDTVKYTVQHELAYTIVKNTGENEKINVSVSYGPIPESVTGVVERQQVRLNLNCRAAFAPIFFSVCLPGMRSFPDWTDTDSPATTT